MAGSRPLRAVGGSASHERARGLGADSAGAGAGSGAGEHRDRGGNLGHGHMAWAGDCDILDSRRCPIVPRTETESRCRLHFSWCATIATRSVSTSLRPSSLAFPPYGNDLLRPQSLSRGCPLHWADGPAFTGSICDCAPHSVTNARHLPDRQLIDHAGEPVALAKAISHEEAAGLNWAHVRI